MPTIHANGIDIYYEQRGEGPDLLLVMGLGAHSGAWALNAPALAKHFRVTTFDNRGSGRTTAPDEPYSMRLMAADTAALMDSLGIAHAHVVGASMGGMIAQELAINFPEKVDRLVIACSRARAGELRRLVSVAQRALWVAGVPRECITAIQQPWGSTGAILQDEQKPLDRLALAAKEPYPMQTHAYLRQLDATMDHDTFDRLQRIAAPTLVLVGGEDVLTPPFESAEIARLIPGAELRILPRGGHGFSAEYPDDFNRAVREFLAR
ncbi:MAG: alpha/beta fold hydrolase [Dehalococcoidia bacterium]|nr:alpha/beta fold hydrolase [Dehalococcoidia bacterium]